MKLNSLINAYHFQYLIERHSHNFSDYELKFLVNMLAAANYETDVSHKQYQYTQVLVQRLKTYEVLV